MCYTVSGVGLLIQYFPLTVFHPVRCANQILWKPNIFNKKAPDLYVEIRLDQVVQRTRVIKRNLTPTWDEDLTL